MNTNMTGLRWLKYLCSWALDTSSLSIERVKAGEYRANLIIIFHQLADSWNIVYDSLRHFGYGD